MSIAATKWANKQNLGTTAKAVLKALAERANSANQCWPSIQTISKDSGASRSSVKRYIKVLKERQFINYFRRKVKDNTEDTSNLYVLKINNKSGEGHYKKHSPSKKVGPTPVQGEPTGYQGGPQTINEPKEKRITNKGCRPESEQGLIIDQKTIDEFIIDEITQQYGEEFAKENKSLIRGKIIDYKRFCAKKGLEPGYGSAIEFVLTGISNKIKSTFRTAKITAGLDEKATATANHQSSIAKSIQQKTSEIARQVRSTIDVVTDRSWADGCSFGGDAI